MLLQLEHIGGDLPDYIGIGGAEVIPRISVNARAAFTVAQGIPFRVGFKIAQNAVAIGIALEFGAERVGIGGVGAGVIHGQHGMLVGIGL